MAKFNVDGIQNVEVSKKLPPQMSPSEQLALMQRYTDTHRACADLSKEEREVRCLRVLYPALLRRMEPGDLFLGRLDFLPIGFGCVTSLGGVGRNIAHNMALLGLDVRFLTAFGDDLYAQRIAASCGELGIDISQALRVPGGSTSTYLYLNGPDGDMALAVSDMDICRKMTPQFLASRLTLLKGAQLIVADANLPAESLRFLADHGAAPLFVDPVSTVKAEKLRPILGKIHTLKPNRMEAELLSGVAITNEESLRQAAQVLLDTGLRRVFISLGSRGLFAADHRESLLLPCRPAAPVNATGAGDAFMAGLAWAYLEGTDLRGTALAGASAGAIAIEGSETINPALSPEVLRARMDR